MIAYFCFYKCLTSILQPLAQFLRLLLSKLSFWNEKESVARNAVVSTRKCFFVLDCFGVTGKLQEYIQWTKTLAEIS